MLEGMKLIIFTDLDGTLLDHHSYSFAAARPALDRIAARRIPLVIVSSKTRSEIEPMLAEAGFARIFISENGSGIFRPGEGGYEMVRLGIDYAEAVEALKAASAACGVAVEGFHEMSVARVAGLTGLDLQAADLAKRRDFSEPFMVRSGDPEVLAGHLRAQGYNVIRGGRFWHLLGDCDKGRAVRKVMQLLGGQRSIALGDSPNDLDMLRAADIGVVVQRHDGSYMDLSSDPGLRRAGGIGPAGWNAAVLELLGAESEIS